MFILSLQNSYYHYKIVIYCHSQSRKMRNVANSVISVASRGVCQKENLKQRKAIGRGRYGMGRYGMAVIREGNRNQRGKLNGKVDQGRP